MLGYAGLNNTVEEESICRQNLESAGVRKSEKKKAEFNLREEVQIANKWEAKDPDLSLMKAKWLLCARTKGKNG